ncbi:hypothetical protein BpHYR1_032331 [Brachionus plicatilis]|uniref:Uncharacterized protein n=1 Tax=Brachionus plicatilis TaxID=10195 RepID=A0A3M7S0V8_BRAPC|nr:hypothetical protein BpHYR1_032331 [Brachionus plicatilis]
MLINEEHQINYTKEINLNNLNDFQFDFTFLFSFFSFKPVPVESLITGLITVSNITIESLVKELSIKGNVMQFWDEFSTFISTFGLYKSSSDFDKSIKSHDNAFSPRVMNGR